MKSYRVISLLTLIALFQTFPAPSRAQIQGSHARGSIHSEVMHFLPVIEPVSTDCLSSNERDCSIKLNLQDELVDRYVKLREMHFKLNLNQASASSDVKRSEPTASRENIEQMAVKSKVVRDFETTLLALLTRSSIEAKVARPAKFPSFTPAIIKLESAPITSELGRYLKTLKEMGTLVYIIANPFASGSWATYLSSDLPSDNEIHFNYSEFIPMIAATLKPTMTMLHEAQHAELTQTNSWRKKAPYSIFALPGYYRDGHLEFKFPFSERLKSGYKYGFSFQEIFTWQQQVELFEKDRSRVDALSFGFPWIVNQPFATRARAYRDRALELTEVGIESLSRPLTDLLSGSFVITRLSVKSGGDIEVDTELEPESINSESSSTPENPAEPREVTKNRSLRITVLKESFANESQQEVDATLKSIKEMKSMTAVQLQAHPVLYRALVMQLSMTLDHHRNEERKLRDYISKNPLPESR